MNKQHNATATPVLEVAPAAETLWAGFARQVERDPAAVAVIAGDRRLTYGELAARADAVAAQLLARELGRGDVVALVMPRGWAAVAALLGVMKAGAAVMALDPDTPDAAARNLLEREDVKLIIGTGGQPFGAARPGLNFNSLQDRGEDDLSDAGQPHDIALISFEPGADGPRVGVCHRHAGPAAAVAALVAQFDIGAGDRMVLLAPLSYDLALLEIFTALSSGAALVVPGLATLFEAESLTALLKRERITVWHAPTPVLANLLGAVEARGLELGTDLRLVMMARERVGIQLIKRLRRHCPGARLVALGGVREAGPFSCLLEVDQVDPQWTALPWGTPLDGHEPVILNTRNKPCPNWVTGRLHLAGPGLAAGYRHEAADAFLTLARIEGPVLAIDLWARRLPDGRIDVLGDDRTLVKVRGNRVELRKIEALLEAHEAVRDVLVIVPDADSNQLQAHVVWRGEPMSLDALIDSLPQKLPESMQPHSLHTLHALPVTAAGTLDRPSLAALDLADRETAVVHDPQILALARQLSPLVANVLDFEELDIHLNLLEHGVNSVNLIRIANELEREFGFRPQLEGLFRQPDVVQMAVQYSRFLSQRDEPETAPETAAPPQTPPPTHELITDPEQREAFKSRARNLRSDLDDRPRVTLPLQTVEDERFALRRSQREFSLKPIALADFSAWLGELRRLDQNGKPKYLYPSAGGTYAVQNYLYVKPGRVTDLAGGCYYHHPVEHTLIAIDPDARVDRRVFGWFNAPVFDRAAFALFHFCELEAIGPLYGEISERFSLYEAGCIDQLLSESAPRYKLGVCICSSHTNYEAVKPLFRLGDSHRSVLALLGGYSDPAAAAGENRAEGAGQTRGQQIKGMLDKIDQLSKDEIKAMLAARKQQR
jgi:SagB-type dehydrogenase family enzyme